MSLEKTALWSEFLAIISGGSKPVHFHWVLQITANGVTYESTKVMSIDLIREYDKNYSDEIMVEGLFPSGTYQHLIMPYRANLLCELIGSPLGEVTGAQQTSQPMPSQKMRAMLIDTKSQVIDGGMPGTANLDAMNLTDLTRVRFQLVDLTLEQVRMKSVGGIYRKTTPGDAIKHIMVAALADLKLNTDDTVVGLDMVEPDNTQPRDHIIIPHGTRFVDVPDLIHNQWGGVYSTGFGFYLQNAMWYVYPTFNIKRFDKAPKTLTFINLPKNRYPELERTYRTTSAQTIILVTGDTSSKDDSEELIHNQGNGIRFTDAKRVFSGEMVDVKNNIATAYRAKNNNEYLSELRTNGLNNAHMSPSKITDNAFREMSTLARRSGRHVRVTWEHCDPSLITPNIPCKYMYLVHGQVMESEGVVLAVHAYTYLDGQGLTTEQHGIKAVITLFIDKAHPWIEDEPGVDTSVLADVNASTSS